VIPTTQEKSHEDGDDHGDDVVVLLQGRWSTNSEEEIANQTSTESRHDRNRDHADEIESLVEDREERTSEGTNSYCRKVDVEW
jgi:hypothetical protein